MSSNIKTTVKNSTLHGTLEPGRVGDNIGARRTAMKSAEINSTQKPAPAAHPDVYNRVKKQGNLEQFAPKASFKKLAGPTNGDQSKPSMKPALFDYFEKGMSPLNSGAATGQKTKDDYLQGFLDHVISNPVLQNDRTIKQHLREKSRQALAKTKTTPAPQAAKTITNMASAIKQQPVQRTQGTPVASSVKTNAVKR